MRSTKIHVAIFNCILRKYGWSVHALAVRHVALLWAPLPTPQALWLLMNRLETCLIIRLAISNCHFKFRIGSQVDVQKQVRRIDMIDSLSLKVIIPLERCWNLSTIVQSHVPIRSKCHLRRLLNCQLDYWSSCAAMFLTCRKLFFYLSFIFIFSTIFIFRRLWKVSK